MTRLNKVEVDMLLQDMQHGCDAIKDADRKKVQALQTAYNELAKKSGDAYQAQRAKIDAKIKKFSAQLKQAEQEAEKLRDGRDAVLRNTEAYKRLLAAKEAVQERNNARRRKATYIRDKIRAFGLTEELVQAVQDLFREYYDEK